MFSIPKTILRGNILIPQRITLEAGDGSDLQSNQEGSTAALSFQSWVLNVDEEAKRETRDNRAEINTWQESLTWRRYSSLYENLCKLVLSSVTGSPASLNSLLSSVTASLRQQTGACHQMETGLRESSGMAPGSSRPEWPMTAKHHAHVEHHINIHGRELQVRRR